MATAEERGFYYAKLGSTKLICIEKPSFRITEELNKIPSFEFEIANCSDNRTAIAAGITEVFRIYRRIDSTDTLMFTGIINGDAIEYLSLERIRITGYASFIDLNWRFHQHLNSEDAENVDKVYNYTGSYSDKTTEANNDTINDVPITYSSVNDALYVGQGEQFFGMQIKYSTKGVQAAGMLDSMDATTGWSTDGAMSNITVNTTEKKEGTGALNLIKALTSSYNAGILKTISSVDLESKDVMVWLFLKDAPTKNKLSVIEVNLADSGQNGAEWHFSASSLSVGWNLLTVDTSTPPDYSDPSVDLTDITEIQLYVNTNQATDTYAEGDVIADYYRYIPGTSVVVFEYSKGSSVWATLDVLDETRAFTEDPGTYYITIPHKPSDWAKDTVNSVKKFWVRARLSVGSYTTSPALDRIKMTNIDVYRVYYFETAADTIMTDVLAGTGYSMDVTDVCPSDTISIVAEYETKLRIIAGIANALTWDDSGDKRAYQWWIDTSKKVHFKQKRGATLGDITGELTILNNIEDYFNLSNRLHFLGNYDGLSKLRAIIENTDSQDTHKIRELAVSEERYNNYIPLKEAAQKAMTYTKAPLQKIAATVTTKYWLDNSFEVGDTVTLYATSWDVASQAFQIVRADIGPRVTNLDMGISQEHLDGLKAGLQRQLDITGIRMHGSTTLLQFGPETMNYHRVNDSTVYPSRLKIEIPSDVRYIHKVLLSWTIGPYRADVEPDTGSTSGHDHTGYTGSSSAHDHTGTTGLDGAHIPIALAAGAHDHDTDLEVNMVLTKREGYLPDSKNVSYESSHTHTGGTTGAGTAHSHSNPSTGTASTNHTHSIPATDGPDDVRDALVDILDGSACVSGYCQTGYTVLGFAEDTHWHLNTGKNSGSSGAAHTHNQGVTGTESAHTHSAGTTGAGSQHRHVLSTHAVALNYMRDIQLGVAASTTEPAHNTTINSVADHTNPITSEAGESLTVATEPGESVAVQYGIHEEAAGTTLELLVNSEVVASSYVGDQTDIRIDGYLSTGNNTVEILPIVGENGKKGSCTVLGAGIFFIEAKKF